MEMTDQATRQNMAGGVGFAPQKGGKPPQANPAANPVAAADYTMLDQYLDQREALANQIAQLNLITDACWQGIPEGTDPELAKRIQRLQTIQLKESGVTSVFAPASQRQARTPVFQLPPAALSPAN